MRGPAAKVPRGCMAQSAEQKPRPGCMWPTQPKSYRRGIEVVHSTAQPAQPK
jgi:hypothetical protein